MPLAIISCGKSGANPSAASGTESPILENQVATHSPADQGRHLGHTGDESARPPPATPAPYRPGKPWSTAEQSQYSTIRVKIFPHNSKYTEPNGPESRHDSLTFESTGDCSLYPARTASARSGYDPKEKPIIVHKSITVSANTLQRPTWVVCPEPPLLKRIGAKTQPARYSGKFFVKKVTPAGGPPYITVVNELPLEEYVKGVVPSEVPNSWPLETLKAQAVAARTYALYTLSEHDADRDVAIQREESGADLDDTVEYQAYLGITTAGPSSNQAVTDTAGQVITYKGTLVDAFFHADSGGHTEDAANVWGVVVPYAVGKPEVFPNSLVRDSAWTVTETLGKLETRLAKPAHESQLSLTGLNLGAAELTPSGRARVVGLNTSQGTIWISGLAFQSALELHSNLMQFVDASNGAIKIEGRGFGHGVGLSQWGAKILATHYRLTYDEILKFYYTDIDLMPPEKR